MNRRMLQLLEDSEAKDLLTRSSREKVVSLVRTIASVTDREKLDQVLCNDLHKQYRFPLVSIKMLVSRAISFLKKEENALGDAVKGASYGAGKHDLATSSNRAMNRSRGAGQRYLATSSNRAMDRSREVSTLSSSSESDDNNEMNGRKEKNGEAYPESQHSSGINDEDDNHWEVVSILNHVVNKKGMFYKVQWKKDHRGEYWPDDLNWVHSSEMSCPELVKKYEEKMHAEYGQKQKEHPKKKATTKRARVVQKKMVKKRTSATEIIDLCCSSDEDATDCPPKRKTEYDVRRTDQRSTEKMEAGADIKDHGSENRSNWRVVEILDHYMFNDGAKVYKVKWMIDDGEDILAEEEKWLSADSMNCPELVATYERSLGLAAGPSPSIIITKPIPLSTSLADAARAEKSLATHISAAHIDQHKATTSYGGTDHSKQVGSQSRLSKRKQGLNKRSEKVQAPRKITLSPPYPSNEQSDPFTEPLFPYEDIAQWTRDWLAEAKRGETMAMERKLEPRQCILYQKNDDPTKHGRALFLFLLNGEVKADLIYLPFTGRYTHFYRQLLDTLMMQIDEHNTVCRLHIKQERAALARQGFFYQ